MVSQNAWNAWFNLRRTCRLRGWRTPRASRKHSKKSRRQILQSRRFLLTVRPISCIMLT